MVHKDDELLVEHVRSSIWMVWGRTAMGICLAVCKFRHCKVQLTNFCITSRKGRKGRKGGWGGRKEGREKGREVEKESKG